MKRILTIMLAAIGLVACTSQKKADEPKAPSTLVLYYSQTGATKAVAEEIQKQLGADIASIEVEQPYDGDFGQTIERCQKEMAANEIPVVKPLSVNVADYDVIFLGYPVWFGTYARPIAGLFQSVSFEGKKVVTFCTFGSGGLQASTRDVKTALSGAEVVEGYGVRTARVASAPAEVTRFLIEGGYVEGQIEALPPYSEHHEASADEAAIFNQACGSYQFPLGTPKTVAVRQTATSTDYEFTVQENPTTIYVTVGKAEGSVPEFTQVVR